MEKKIHIGSQIHKRKSNTSLENTWEKDLEEKIEDEAWESILEKKK